MPKAVLAIIMNPHSACQVARLWEQLGVPGTTIIGSLGYAAFKERLLQDDLPLIPSLHLLMDDEEEIGGSQRMLLSVVCDDFDVDHLLDETERILGEFNQPYSGIAFVLPVLQARGLRQGRSARP